MMNTARSATADAFARAPLPKRFCNLDRLLHAMKARGLDGIVATAPWNVMKLPRRNFLHLAAGAAALPAVSRFAWAQTYPVRPVTIIVPVAPGGTTDVAARIIGEYMARLLGQQFIVENVPGAGGTTGSTRAVIEIPELIVARKDLPPAMLRLAVESTQFLPPRRS